ncbi:hypothetical protein GCM10008955_15330 [Deinococcus malanensis]|uniref:Uncharacterized protein n=1 Tax=Deinococcus malanensis TaxID=1706855 RepID=A0ABQ2ERW6_9DEIO|nr:hypothetical protein [Deinococcus malanensis]GGK22797.1 hypothetical protein GCM10008955_15330 [Deinococcus malanensis]
MTQQPHATRADIEAILKARRLASVEAVSIPALPPMKTDEPKMVTAQVESSLTELTITQPATLPVVVVAPEPKVDDLNVEEMLEDHLPILIADVIEIAAPPFRFEEVVKLGQSVSEAVKIGLPQVQKLEARVLVVATARYVWRKYGTPPSICLPRLSLSPGSWSRSWFPASRRRTSLP